ncbi:MAG: hypothetical protein OCD02_23760 [Spirochaetaceae bacterium]
MKVFGFILLLLTTSHLYSEISLSEIQGSGWSDKQVGNITYYTKKDYGRVPILCFHKIGDAERYEITSENFKNFLIYLNDNKYYPISDKDFLNRDFAKVPTGYKPIVLGSDDASEGNFIYKTNDDSIYGELDLSTGKPEHDPNSMVYLLEKFIRPEDGNINFTFYISFNGIPFRQTGGDKATGEYFRGIDLIGQKFNYLLDNFIVGIHTVTHPVTKNTSAKDFKWEIDEFYNILYSYVGERINLIDTLAYPYGCANLKPEMEKMIKNYNTKGVKIVGAFDFDGYFSQSPFSSKIKDFDISRFGVDNKNIQNLYGFLESVPQYKTERIIVVKSKTDLLNVNISDDDIVMVVP